MNAATREGSVPDIVAESREVTRRQLQLWFDWMDRILDIHRSNFVFREATPAELEQHKTALKLAIRYSLFINAVVSDPDFKEPELASRVNIRIRQLQDAYDTFHDAEVSEETAERILRQVFPE